MASPLEIYYWPIGFTNCFPGAFPDNINRMKGSPPFVLTNEDEIRNLYRALNTANKPGRLNESDLRFLVEAAGSRGHPAYFMDGQGNVRKGKTEYQISPRAFYEAVTLMDSYAVKRFQEMTESHRKK